MKKNETTESSLLERDDLLGKRGTRRYSPKEEKNSSSPRRKRLEDLDDSL